MVFALQASYEGLGYVFGDLRAFDPIFRDKYLAHPRPHSRSRQRSGAVPWSGQFSAGDAPEPESARLDGSAVWRRCRGGCGDRPTHGAYGRRGRELAVGLFPPGLALACYHRSGDRRSQGQALCSSSQIHGAQLRSDLQRGGLTPVAARTAAGGPVFSGHLSGRLLDLGLRPGRW